MRTWIVGLVLLLGCAPAVERPAPTGGARALATALPALPDSAGVPPHVLALARSPRDELWVGTYGRGIFVLRQGARQWERITSGDSTAISWDFVNSFAFGPDSLDVWYGTVGNGYGLSRDGGRSWRNWQFRQLGPEWQYVAPDGIRVRDSVVYVATADGLRWSDDLGASWHCIGAADAIEGGTPVRPGSCVDRLATLPSEYLLALDVTEDGTLWVGHLRGASVSRDRGRSWQPPQGAGRLGRVRDLIADDSAGIWIQTEGPLLRAQSRTGLLRIFDLAVPPTAPQPGAPRALVPQPRPGGAQPGALRQRQGEEPGYGGATSPPPMVVTSNGALVYDASGPRVAFIAAADRLRAVADLWTGLWLGSAPVAGSAVGLQRVLAGEAPPLPASPDQIAQPEAPRHLWFRRPVADTAANPFIDGTYRYGSTMGGNFQQHQGVEFNNPAGTPVYAVGDGVVAFAGPAEQGALTVAIRHDRRLDERHVFTTYFHNTALAVRAGQRVRAGDLIARIGNTGRATNDHLHLEVHVAPTPDSSAIINPAERFPPFTVNPQLWIQPAPGTGIVAGRVLDAAGLPVPGARIYGLVVPYPTETPFSFAETYRERAHPDPAYGEHFAVGDVSPGDYLLHTEIEGGRVWRRVRVAAGQVTWVEFRR